MTPRPRGRFTTKISPKPERNSRRTFRPNTKSIEEWSTRKDKLKNSGGGGWTRTNDLRIMSSDPSIAGKEDKELSSAESGKPLQDPQPPRNSEQAPNPTRKGPESK
jgi:hypothetical protein